MANLYATGICPSSMEIPTGYLSEDAEKCDYVGMTNIANIRKMRGLSQADLAEIVGVRQPHISRIENGDDGIPLRLLKEIAAALQVELVDLFGDERLVTERLLLDAYRHLPGEMKEAWGAMARAVLDPDSQSHPRNHEAG